MSDTRVIWTVEVRTTTGEWTTHSEWSNRKDAIDQADMVGGRVVRAEVEPA